MAIEERHIMEELHNIVRNGPLWPGDTISHTTAKECERRGWAKRNAVGDIVATKEGLRVHVKGTQGGGE